MNRALESLYPSLRKQAEAGASELVTSIRAKAQSSIEAKQRLFESQSETLLRMAQVLADAFRTGGRLLTMGNGGSSADAAHVAVEFNHPVTVGRPALPATDLGADIAFVTALGNDVGFDQIFARQVIARGCKGDCLLGLSTSGNSTNLLAAFETAHGRGLRTLGFAGGDGGHMKTSPFVDHCLVVDSPSIHRVQECHVLSYHILWDIVHTLLAQDRTGAEP